MLCHITATLQPVALIAANCRENISLLAVVLSSYRTHCISISSTLLSMYCVYHFVASGSFVELWCSLIFYEDVFQCAALCFSGVLQDAAITAILLT